MLVLSRKLGETIVIGNDIVVTVVRLGGEKVRLGITAPKGVAVHREEVYREIHGRSPGGASAGGHDGQESSESARTSPADTDHAGAGGV